MDGDTQVTPASDQQPLKWDGTPGSHATDKEAPHHHKLQNKLLRLLAIVLVLLQALWAVVIPVKNVVVMPYPKITENQETITQSKYDRDNEQIATRTIPGKDAYRIVKEVVELSLTNQDLRNYFESKNDFVIDDISHLLTPQQHQLFGQYYSLLFQASEFQAGGVVQREQKVYTRMSKSTESILITITCSRQQVFQGMRCVNPKGIMCDDVDWQKPYDLTLTPIDLGTLTNGTGWHNKGSLMGFVTHTHDAMRLLFSKKDWRKVFSNIDVLPYKWRTLPTSDPSILMGYPTNMVFASPWNKWAMDDYLRAGIRKFESCFTTEFILGYHFAGFFAANIIQKPLIDLGLYGATDLINNTQTYDQVFDEMFGSDVLITHGAGHYGLVDDKKTFLGTPMTQVLTSTVTWKKDRPMTGPILMGSSPRVLEYWMYFPDLYYSYHNDSVDGDTAVSDYRELGGYHSGFNGFKYDFIRNTMGVIRLSERRFSKGTGYSTDWFEEEKKIAQWYRNHELNDPNSLVTLAKKVWGEDFEPLSWQPYCMEAIYRRIAQAIWIMALQKQPVMNFLVYQSMIDPDTPSTWWYKQLSVNQIIGEQITGYRVAHSYFRDTFWVTDGEGWVLIPLLNAFRKEMDQDKLLTDVMGAMNTTFKNLLSITNGKLWGFCPMGYKTMGVTDDDSKNVIWGKVYGRFREMVNQTINMVDTIHQQMIAAGLDVTIPRQYVVYNRTNNVFPSEGPPLYWTHTPLSVGLIKLATVVSPDESQMKVYRDSLVCYDTLEWRFLNISTRCWSEPQSFREVFEKTKSDGLRMLKFSMWSLGVVLNISGAVVALRFALRIWKLWYYYRFSDLNMLLALNMDFQGIGMISLDGVLIMAFSCVPLILSYHMPDDTKFMPNEKEKPNPLFAEFMVLLSLTWFIRLGIELGIFLIALKHYNWWFNLLASRIRLFTLVVVGVARMAITTKTIDYNRGLTKLIASALLSTLLGFLSVVVSVCFDKESRHSDDGLSRMMSKRRLARNVYGVLGQLQSGWTHAGMVVEGWQAFTINGKVDMFVCGSQWLPLESTRSEFAMVPLTRQMLADAEGAAGKVAKSVVVVPAHGTRVTPM